MFHLFRTKCNTVLHILSFSFLKNIFIDYAIIVVPFPPLHSTLSCTLPPSHIPPLQFMSMGHTYKFFGFYISCTILTLPLVYFLPIIYATYSLYLSPLSPPPTPLITLHVISISVTLFLFQLFAQFVFIFVFVLGVVVNNHEFVVILLFIVLIFFFLDKSL